jgi:biotin carboxylase
MPNALTLVVGYSPAAVKSLQNLFPGGSVVLIEEPDIIRKRDLSDLAAQYTVLERLMPYEYQREAAADALYRHCDGWRVASVVPIVEYATPFAARLAELFQVPGAGFQASLTLRNKHRLREVTASQGIRNPRSQRVTTLEEVHRFAQANPGPLIIKPGNRQGSVGTVIVRDHAELEAAWETSKQRDEGVMVPDRDIPEITLIEEFVTGSEYSVEALVRQGQMIFSNVTAKDLFPGSFPVERAHVVPAPLRAAVSGALVDQTRAVITATGFDTGIVHCEWILSNDEPCLVECAGRFAGDGIIDLIERAYGFDIVAAYHALMRGEDLPVLPTQAAKAATVRFVGGQNAEITGIEIDESILSQPGVAHHYLTARVGDRARVPTMSWHRLGAVTVEAADAASAIALAERAVEAIKITFAAEGSV